MPILELSVNGILQYVLFCVRLLSFNIMPERLIHVVVGRLVYSFSLLPSMLFFGLRTPSGSGRDWEVHVFPTILSHSRHLSDLSAPTLASSNPLSIETFPKLRSRLDIPLFKTLPFLPSLKMPSHKLFINYKDKNSNLMVEKLGRLHHNQTLKVNVSSNKT